MSKNTPPPLTTDDVKAIATLSRLKLGSKEVTQATKQLGNVLGHFAAIQKIKTADVPPADAVSGLKNIARSDEAATDVVCATDKLLEAFPNAQGRQLKVPAVFE